MPITSYIFAIFTVLSLLIYYLIKGRLQNVWLLAVSYIFILAWNWQFAVVLLLITAFNFLLANLLAERKHKPLLILGISANLLVLLFFRTINFLLPETQAFLSQMGIKSQFDGIFFLLPLGLSYHVLQNISYLADVFRGQIPPSNNFIHFALYLAYFPKLIAGPIERARTFLPKLAEKATLTTDALAKNGLLIIVGLIRKLVIADSLSATIPALIFENPSSLSPIDLIGWLIVYAFVIYNDFAGYTGIARGVSGLFGIELSINFNYPYFARNFSEFWNRWHISLSHWLRDYIYYPLSRALSRALPNRNNLINIVVPPLITMVASGLWHGLSWHMIFWGALHGAYQVVERFLISRKPLAPPDQQPLWRQLLSSLVVFFFVLIAWVPFRMELPIAIEYWKGMLNFGNISVDSGRLLLILPYIGFWLIVDWFLYKKKDEFIWLQFPQLVRAGLLAIALLLVVIAKATETNTPFIYQGF